MINAVTSTYGEVDRSEDPERAADWQERVDAWPAIQAYKRHTFELLRGHGSVLDISTAAFPLVLTDPDDAFGLPSWPRLWQELGRFDDRDIAEWDEGIDGAREHGMIYALLYFVVAATTV